MGETTLISWCDHTFNPWVGCTRVSNGPKGACKHCYAANLVDVRFGWAKFGGPGKGVGTRTRTSEENWRKPLAWNRAAAKAGTRPFVFCASLADVFDKEADPQWRRDLFDLIRATPNLTWLLLTKRPQNILKLFRATIRKDEAVDPALSFYWPRNAAIGCTVVTQVEAERDVPKLLDTKGLLDPAFTFVSMEPLMGPVDLRRLSIDPPKGGEDDGWGMDALEGRTAPALLIGPDGEWVLDGGGLRGPGLDWVITGGETDQGKDKARPSNPEWFRDLRHQCADTGVAYHHKQNGEWVSVSEVEGPGEHFTFPDHRTVRRVGKGRAGRTIDGVIHDARPQVRT